MCPTIQGNVVLFIQGIEVCPTIQGNVVLFIQGIKVYALVFKAMLSCLFKELKCSPTIQGNVVLFIQGIKGMCCYSRTKPSAVELGSIMV